MANRIIFTCLLFFRSKKEYILSKVKEKHKHILWGNRQIVYTIVVLSLLFVCNYTCAESCKKFLELPDTLNPECCASRTMTLCIILS